MDGGRNFDCGKTSPRFLDAKYFDRCSSISLSVGGKFFRGISSKESIRCVGGSRKTATSFDAMEFHRKQRGACKRPLKIDWLYQIPKPNSKKLLVNFAVQWRKKVCQSKGLKGKFNHKAPARINPVKHSVALHVFLIYSCSVDK
jgi:hypothetical protein